MLHGEGECFPERAALTLCRTEITSIMLAFVCDGAVQTAVALPIVGESRGLLAIRADCWSSADRWNIVDHWRFALVACDSRRLLEHCRSLAIRVGCL